MVTIKKYLRAVTLYLCIIFLPINAVTTFVYNIRIAETTKRMLQDKNNQEDCLIISTPIVQFKKKYDGSRIHSGGVMETFIYAMKRYYYRIDSAFGIARASDGSVNKASAQLDDILLSGGYTLSFNPTLQASCSGFLGIPTHNDMNFDVPQIGYAHMALGGQIDSSYMLSTDHTHSVRSAIRLIHFFKKGSYSRDEKQKFKWSPGNLADIFLAYHYHCERHSAEIGYTIGSVFNTEILPLSVERIARTEYKRNTWYGSYKYRFRLLNKSNIFTVSTSYGFDMSPKTFGNKYIVGSWCSWEIDF